MSSEMEAFTGVLRGAMAGILLVMFVGLWVWTFGSRRRATLEAASRLPLEEDRS